MIDVLLYRFERLWRVMVLGVVLPVLTVLYLQFALGEALPGHFAFAVAIPVFHVLRYPQQWVETLTVSLILSAALVLAALFVSPDMPLLRQGLRYAAIGAVAVTAFLMIISPVHLLCNKGPGRRIAYAASLDSRLDIQTLKDGLTHFPGRSDDGAKCTAADENGCFEVTYPIAGIHQFNYENPDGPKLEEIENWDLTQKDEIHQFAIVQDTGPTHHEVIYFDGDLKRFEMEAGDVNVVRHDFTALPGGARESRSRRSGCFCQCHWYSGSGSRILDVIASYVRSTGSKAARRARTERFECASSLSTWAI